MLSAAKKSGVYKVFRVVLMLMSFAFIYYHVSSGDVTQWLFMVRERFVSDPQARSFIYITLLLVPVNWCLEALKWKWLSAAFYRQSFLRALRGVLTGVAVSFFTPNRTGDFAGRILLIPSSHRLNGALFSIAGSLAQLLVTVSAGGVAFILLKDLLARQGSLFPDSLYYFVIAAIVVLHILFLIMPFIGDRLSGMQSQNKWLRRLGNIRHIESSLLARIYILSIFRYAVFTIQFLVLVQAFGVNEDPLVITALIMITFLLITVIPSFALSELGIRGSVTILLFSAVTAQTTSVLMAATFLWFINIVFPAIIGATGMLYFKIEE